MNGYNVRKTMRWIEEIILEIILTVKAIQADLKEWNLSFTFKFNPFHAINAIDAYRFYYNARWFYSSMGKPYAVKGLTWA